MRWLAIGIGNPLRRDDGLGPWLAERIAAWRLPDVAIRIVHQVTPELAAEIAEHDCVLFLDASRGDEEPRPAEIGPAAVGRRLGHAMHPGEALALAECLVGRRPRAWVVPVPGSDFGFGEGLSDAAQRAGERALAAVGDLLREDASCMKSG